MVTISKNKMIDKLRLLGIDDKQIKIFNNCVPFDKVYGDNKHPVLDENGKLNVYWIGDELKKHYDNGEYDSELDSLKESSKSIYKLYHTSTIDDITWSKYFEDIIWSKVAKELFMKVDYMSIISYEERTEVIKNMHINSLIEIIESIPWYICREDGKYLDASEYDSTSENLFNVEITKHCIKFKRVGRNVSNTKNSIVKLEVNYGDDNKNNATHCEDCAMSYLINGVLYDDNVSVHIVKNNIFGEARGCSYNFNNKNIGKDMKMSDIRKFGLVERETGYATG